MLRELSSMFRLARASQLTKEALLATAQQAPLSSPHLLTLTDGPVGTPPKGFAHDVSRTKIGRGQSVFDAAREAFQLWEQFDLGWSRSSTELPGSRAGRACGRGSTHGPPLVDKRQPHSSRLWIPQLALVLCTRPLPYTSNRGRNGFSLILIRRPSRCPT